MDYRDERDALRGRVENLEQELDAATKEQQGLAAELSQARRAAAPRLAKAVRGELAQLAMEDATFEVRLEERDELAASIETTVPNELMQSLRREVRNDAREERRIQQSREPIAVCDFGHGPAMIPALRAKKQS